MIVGWSKACSYTCSNRANYPWSPSKVQSWSKTQGHTYLIGFDDQGDYGTYDNVLVTVDILPGADASAPQADFGGDTAGNPQRQSLDPARTFIATPATMQPVDKRLLRRGAEFVQPLVAVPPSV